MLWPSTWIVVEVLVGSGVFVGDDVGIGVWVIVGGMGVYVVGKDVVGRIVFVGCGVAVGGKVLETVDCCGPAIPDEQLANRIHTKINVIFIFTRLGTAASLSGFLSGLMAG